MKAVVCLYGHVLSEYEGEDRQDILDTYAQDVGYEDYTELIERLSGWAEGAITVEPVEDCPEHNANQMQG